MTTRRTIRLATVPLLLVAVGCPKDKPPTRAAGLRPDTTPADLSGVQTSLPPAALDTFTPPRAGRAQPGGGGYPPAPPALMEAVEREQSFSKFCYQEFGQKSDPTLRGAVSMLVTIAADGLTDARVAADNWSSDAGKSVNGCLNERATRAWKIAPGTVKAGKYIVPLTFRGS